MINFIWKNLVKSGSLWFTALALVLLGAGIWFAIESWDWLHPSTSQQEAADTTPGVTIETTVSNSETLRNVGLLIGGGLAFVFAVWRAWIAEGQSSAAQRQAETAHRQAENVQSQIDIAQSQAETAQQSLLNERYQRGAEMLGSRVLAVRIGAIDALTRLAQEHPLQYHVQVMQLMCAFAREPGGNRKDLVIEIARGDDEPLRRLRSDVQAAMSTIGNRSAKARALEQQENYVPNLTGACLSYLWLEKANLSYVDLSVADLTEAYLHRTKLHRAILASANLSGATLAFADLSRSTLRQAILDSAKLQSSILSNARLDGADLSGAHLADAKLDGATLNNTSVADTDFSHAAQAPARGLTQQQLDSARRTAAPPPHLEGVHDAKTGKPLEWLGNRPFL